MKQVKIHMAYAMEEEGRWLNPEESIKYFRNGRGIKLSSLMYNLRSGKLQDIAYKDAFGWHVFVPQRVIDYYNEYCASKHNALLKITTKAG